MNVYLILHAKAKYYGFVDFERSKQGVVSKK